MAYTPVRLRCDPGDCSLLGLAVDRLHLQQLAQGETAGLPDRWHDRIRQTHLLRGLL